MSPQAVVRKPSEESGRVFSKLAEQKECRIEERHLLADHVHMMISIAPSQRPIVRLGGEEEMNGNQIKLLYAGGAWFAGLFIYRCGSVPVGWGLLGDALGFTIGYSALPRCR